MIKNIKKDIKILKKPAPLFKPVRGSNTDLRDHMAVIDKHYADKMAASDRLFNRFTILCLSLSTICLIIVYVMLSLQ